MPNGISMRGDGSWCRGREVNRQKWRPVGRLIDRCVNPVELDANIAGAVDIVGDVVELVDRNGELQQRNGQQRDRRRTSPQPRCLYVVDFTHQRSIPGYQSRQI